MKLVKTMDAKTKERLLQAGNIVSYLFMVAANATINIVGFKGENNGSISDGHPTAITPANWAFSIWGLIFAGLALFTVYQAIPIHKTNTNCLNQVSWLFILNGFINGIWALPFLAKVWWLALLFMLCILGTLIMINIRIDNGYKLLEDSKENVYARYWCVEFPFSVYYGWICVATVANFAVFLKYTPAISWNTNEVIPTCIMISIIGVLGSLGLIFRRDVAFVGVFVWSTWAISVYQTDPAVILTAQIVFGILLTGCIFTLPYRFFFGRRKRKEVKNEKVTPLTTIKNVTPPGSKIKVDDSSDDVGKESGSSTPKEEAISETTSKEKSVETNQVLPEQVV